METSSCRMRGTNRCINIGFINNSSRADTRIGIRKGRGLDETLRNIQTGTGASGVSCCRSCVKGTSGKTHILATEEKEFTVSQPNSSHELLCGKDTKPGRWRELRKNSVSSYCSRDIDVRAPGNSQYSHSSGAGKQTIKLGPVRADPQFSDSDHR
jgi:hypothetical protein